MNLLEAFGAIFTAIWVFISSPAIMALLGVVICMVGAVVFCIGCVPGTGTKGDGWVRAGFLLGGPLIVITGVAIATWATTSSPDGFNWA